MRGIITDYQVGPTLHCITNCDKKQRLQGTERQHVRATIISLAREARLCLVASKFPNFPSHRNIKYSKWRMHGTLNVGKQNNLLHSLDVRCEMNLLSLVSPS